MVQTTATHTIIGASQSLNEDLCFSDGALGQSGNGFLVVIGARLAKAFRPGTGAAFLRSA
jgi:hypothetical protein